VLVVALWLAVLLGFPPFLGGGPHLPALGPSSPRPSPGALATPSPSGEAVNPGSQAERTGTRLIGSTGTGADEVEDEPPDVEDEPAASPSGVPGAPTPVPAPNPGSVGQNLVPSIAPLPVPSAPGLH